MDQPAYRILLLEDSVADAELIRLELVRAGMAVVTERADTEDAFVRAMRDFVPDVVISDHALAQFNGTGALRAVRAWHAAIPVIVVSGVLDERAVVECLKAGAEDFILKSDLGRLVEVIQAALAVRRPLERLSPRQREVLRLLAEGLLTRAIAGQLRLSVKTVETHRAQLMRRLGIHTLAGLVRYAIRVGLAPPEP